VYYVFVVLFIFLFSLWVRFKSAIFDQYLAVSQKWCKIVTVIVERCWAFSVAGLTVWNSLRDFIRDPTISADVRSSWR